MPAWRRPAQRSGGEQAGKRRDDPAVPYLLGELTNALTTAQLAIDDMVRLANDLDFAMTLDVANAMLVRKTIVAEHVLATVEKALETAGGAGFYRKTGLERLLRDAHGAQFHPLSGKAPAPFHRPHCTRPRPDRGRRLTALVEQPTARR